MTSDSHESRFPFRVVAQEQRVIFEKQLSRSACCPGSKLARKSPWGFVWRNGMFCTKLCSSFRVRAQIFVSGIAVRSGTCTRNWFWIRPRISKLHSQDILFVELKKKTSSTPQRHLARKIFALNSSRFRRFKSSVTLLLTNSFEWNIQIFNFQFLHFRVKNGASPENFLQRREKNPCHPDIVSRLSLMSVLHFYSKTICGPLFCQTTKAFHSWLKPTNLKCRSN